MTELQRLEAAADVFAAAMKKKLRKKFREGWRGWDDSFFITSGACYRRLHEHTFRLMQGYVSEAVDIANFAMFIYTDSQKDGKA